MKNTMKRINTRILIFTLFMVTSVSLAYSQTSAQYWTGNGGRGTKLGILLPQSQGLDESQEYLPVMIQGVLVSNISKYSAISVLDRVSLDKVISETLDLTYEDDLDIVRLGRVAQVGQMMTGNIIKTSTGFSLQINVTNTANGNTIASYSGTCTAAELDDHSAIHRATLDLLPKMNVQLNARARTELGRASTPEAINAQAALAQGITAQMHGTEVEALSHFLRAIAIDPAMLEATSRLDNLSAAISRSNVGEDARGDIQWRAQWVARLRETEEFLAHSADGGGRPIHRKTLYVNFHRALRNIDMSDDEIKERKLHIHGWRHFFNTELLKGGLSVTQAQAFTGHKSERMTEWYLHFDPSDFAKAMKIQETLLEPEKPKEETAVLAPVKQEEKVTARIKADTQSVVIPLSFIVCVKKRINEFIY